MKYKFLLICLLLLIKVNSQMYNYYVSTNGNNITGDGTSGNPFKTIDKAKSVIRNQINTYPMTQDIVVHIAGGSYLLESTLVFTSDDSGKNGHFVIYQAEDPANKPVITSGQTIPTGWTKIQDKDIYKANIGNLYSRQVYVNGHKAIRARSEKDMGLIETSTGYFSTSCTDFSSWANIKDVEIVSDMFWKSYRIPVESVCNYRQIIINNNFWNILHDNYSDPEKNHFKTAPVKWVENALELLDQTDEWYIDRSNSGSHTIYLGSNTIPTNVVIPTLESLISGEDGAGYIKFNNLIFSHTTWNKPSENNGYLGVSVSNNGFITEQADWYCVPTIGSRNTNVIPAAISFKNASHINIFNCEFKSIGSTALSFGESSADNIICSNKFEDIAASAIRVGTVDNTKIESVIRNKIINNTITNIANEYSGSVGIFVPYAKYTTVNHNTLTKFPYTGISVGWGWKKIYNVGVNCIKYNKIDCTDQFMPDGGGIYTQSAQGDATHKTQISGNYILNQRVYLGAIYMDNDASFIDVTGNLIDTDSSSDIPDQIDCNANHVKSIVFYSGSEYVNIIDNYFKSSYLPPPPGNLTCYPACSNITVNNNTQINIMDQMPAAAKDIMNASGVKSNVNCN
ncbi:right-handed parallel beta-helix repeat-containing protein [Epilithonimonas sp. UC225_85]|uniref:right-handed parallel beta-helix repeat-containing protein n=1 Tax=Epilithonimonas sp. UC225_85 TaxID=3350167 RepID=UPI0036D2BAE5